MKFKYDMSNNYFNCYNEAQGIVVNKCKFKKNKSKFIYNYLLQGVAFISITFILYLVLLLISDKNEISDMYFSFAIVFIIVYYFAFFIGYFIESRKSHKGELILDEFGITDIEKDTKIFFLEKELKR